MRKWVKNLVFAGLASACPINFAAAQPSPAAQAVDYRDLVTALRDDVRPIKIADRLAVNATRHFRLVFPDKCEKKGESELHALASRARLEESYILIPALCLWIEVGYEEKSNGVRLDSKFFKAVIKQYSSLIFYHFHPGNLPSLENYFPAYKDLISLVLINADSIWKPDAEIKHRLITKMGTKEYEFSNKQKVRFFMDKFRKTGLRGFEAQNLAYEYMRPKYRTDYYAKVRKCASYSGAIQQKIIACCPIRTNAFTLNYRPIAAGVDFTP